MIVQLINNVFDLFKVIFWNSDDPFLQYLDLCIQPDYEIFHFFCDFFLLFF